MNRNNFYLQRFKTGDTVCFKSLKNVPYTTTTISSVTPEKVTLENGYFLYLNTPEPCLYKSGFTVFTEDFSKPIQGGTIYPSTEEYIQAEELCSYWAGIGKCLKNGLHPDTTLADLQEVAKILKIDLEDLGTIPKTVNTITVDN